MNLLGIDYGKKRIGLAIGESETKIASPLGIVENKNWDFVLEKIKKICRAEEVGKVVVGVPITMPGAVGPQAKEVLKFIDFLKNNLEVQVEKEDERLTSAMADKLVVGTKIKERDALSAMVILQNYLDKMKL